MARGVAYAGVGSLGTQGMRTGSPMRSKPNGVGLAARRSASLTPYCAAMVAHWSPGRVRCCSHSASGGQPSGGDGVEAGVCARSGDVHATPRLTATNQATMQVKRRRFMVRLLLKSGAARRYGAVALPAQATSSLPSASTAS